MDRVGCAGRKGVIEVPLIEQARDSSWSLLSMLASDLRGLRDFLLLKGGYAFSVVRMRFRMRSGWERESCEERERFFGCGKELRSIVWLKYDDGVGKY